MLNPFSDRFNRALDRIGFGLLGFTLALAIGHIIAVMVFSAACQVEGERKGLRVEYRRDGGCVALVAGLGWTPVATAELAAHTTTAAR